MSSDSRDKLTYSGSLNRPTYLTCYDHKDLNTVNIRDGDKRKDYNICRGLLTWHSAYFAAALDPNGGFVKIDSNTIELEESIEVFDAFYCWLYTSKLKDTPTTSVKAPDDLYLLYEDLNKIWIFAASEASQIWGTEPSI